jgi:hypothetical protein
LIIDPPGYDCAAVQVDGASCIVAPVQNHDRGGHPRSLNCPESNFPRALIFFGFSKKTLSCASDEGVQIFFVLWPEFSGNVVYRYRLFIKNLKKFCIA